LPRRLSVLRRMRPAVHPDRPLHRLPFHVGVTRERLPRCGIDVFPDSKVRLYGRNGQSSYLAGLDHSPDRSGRSQIQPLRDEEVPRRNRGRPRRCHRDWDAAACGHRIRRDGGGCRRNTSPRPPCPPTGRVFSCVDARIDPVT
jgi:hypothetical protein